MSDLIHPGLLAELGDFFPDTCTIQTLSEEPDSSGELQPVWTDFADHVDIPCSVSPAGGDEVRTDVQTYAVATHAISLQGHYPAITAAMRAIIDGEAYDILLPEHSGYGLNTVLKCRVVAI